MAPPISVVTRRGTERPEKVRRSQPLMRRRMSSHSEGCRITARAPGAVLELWAARRSAARYRPSPA